MAKIFTIGFLVFLGFSVLYHRRLMEESTNEIMLRAALEEDKSIILIGKNYFINRFRKGEIMAQFQGGQGAIYANGQMVLTHDLELRVPGREGSQPIWVRTQQAQGRSEVFTPGDSFANSRRQLRVLHLPQPVVIVSGQETAKTQGLDIDLQDMVARSTHPVVIDGKFGKLSGVGFEYKILSGELEMGGPVEGFWQPVQRGKGT